MTADRMAGRELCIHGSDGLVGTDRPALSLIGDSTVTVPNGERAMSLRQAILGVAMGVSVLAVSTLNASAAIVCTGAVCWHSHETYQYPPAAGVIVHEDTWKAGPGITFREHSGRGYWKGDAWESW
jgi:hypothetical protein